jgi:hypothetical protein
MLHASPADIDVVIVDGVVRKSKGSLVDVEVDGAAREMVRREKLEWSEIAKETVKSRERIQKEIEGLDVEAGVRTLMGMWGVPNDVVVDIE